MQTQPLGAESPDVSAVNGAMPTTMTSPPPTPQLNGTLDGIAQQLSMTPDALRQALAGGSSITDLAQQAGVSRDSLVQSVEAQIQQTRQSQGQPPLDQTQLDRMVNRAFDRHRGHHGHHHAQVASATDAQQTPAPDTTTPAQGTGGVDVLA